MPRKHLFFALVAALAMSVVPDVVAAKGDKISIGFLPGVVDPFYQVMQLGVEAAAKKVNVAVVTQVPPTWGVAVQTPI